MSNIWLISDTHFCHQNIIDYENRPFTSTDEMDEYMIQQWNETIKPEDTVWHLGDFALTGGDNEKCQSIFNRLNGSKNLIIGNHDKKTRTKWREVGFKYVEKKSYILNNIILTHYPLPLEEIIELKKKGIAGNAHGHVHSKNSHLDPSLYLCLSVELTNYKPVLLNEVVAYFK